MNEMYESCAGHDDQMQHQMDRVVEYERKLMRRPRKPLLAAMFLLYFVASLTMITVTAYWLFY